MHYSTIALGDSTGTLQTQYTYEPFGYTTESGSSSTNSYKYTGREDDGSGLLYYRARYYHPRLQRFISEDPIGFAGGDVNFYAYASLNPLRFADPYGYSSVGDFLGGSGSYFLGIYDAYRFVLRYNGAFGKCGNAIRGGHSLKISSLRPHLINYEMMPMLEPKRYSIYRTTL